MQGIRGRNEIIHEEPLFSYPEDSKQGSKMTSGELTEPIKNAMSSHSEYKKGTWLDLQRLWTNFKFISNNILNEDIMQKEISLWDDGTYKFLYRQNNLSEKHKTIIKNKIINKEHKNLLYEIYENTTLECEYHWYYDAVKYDIYINAFHIPNIPQRYTINEYDISPNFDYIETLVKSDYLFDYNKNK